MIFGGVTGYSGGWCALPKVRTFETPVSRTSFNTISLHACEHPHEIVESDYFTATGEYKVDAAVSPR